MKGNDMQKQRKQQFLRVGACLILLCGLLYTPKVVVVYAWTDADYFQAVYDCDDYHYDVPLNDCRNLPFYPWDPDEGDCRYAAGNSFLECLNGIPSPAYEPDFCAAARAANDLCLINYGPDSGNTDLGAMMSCRTASGIDQCQ